MRLKTGLNRCLRFKGFVYGKSEFSGKAIMVTIEPRKGCQPLCAACGTPGPVYDHERNLRVFEHIAGRPSPPRRPHVASNPSS
jgi:hypothetical protein